jgi:peptidoglycan/xylan/chitin deacetylase (PgdA/CDA1 family)
MAKALPPKSLKKVKAAIAEITNYFENRNVFSGQIRSTPFIQDTILWTMGTDEGWTAEAAKDIDLADADHTYGTTSIRITTPTGGNAYVIAPIYPRQIFNSSYIRVRVKISEPQNLSSTYGIQFKLYNSSVGATNNYAYKYEFKLDAGDTNAEWRTIILPSPHYWGKGASAPSIESCNVFNCIVHAKPETTVTVRVDAIQFVKTTPSVILWCDDGLKSVYDIAFPIVKKYPKIKLACAIITNKVGTENYMSWDEIDEMASYGHLMVSHSHNHINLSSADEATILSELRLSQEALLAHGHYNGARFFVNPNGGKIPDAQKSLFYKMYLSERPLHAGTYTPLTSILYNPNEFAFKYKNTDGDITDASIDTILDNVAKSGTAYEFTLHGFVTDIAEVGAYRMMPEKFEYLCNAISSRNIHSALPSDVFDKINYIYAEDLI